MPVQRPPAAAFAVPVLALLWGLNWPAVRVVLSWWSPWTLRAFSLGVGALLLFAVALHRRESLQVKAGPPADGFVAFGDRRPWTAGGAVAGVWCLDTRAPLFALAAGISWAAGTVFVKRYPIDVAAIAGTAWQLVVGALLSVSGWLLFGEASPATEPYPATWFGIALAFHVILATALAYLIWFDVVARLPAGVAALGTLPV